MKIDWVKIGLWVVDLLRKLFFAAGVRQGRAEVSQEQKEKADAVRADYDAIANDGRTVDDAVVRLRSRRSARKASEPRRP